MNIHELSRYLHRQDKDPRPVIQSETKQIILGVTVACANEGKPWITERALFMRVEERDPEVDFKKFKSILKGLRKSGDIESENGGFEVTAQNHPVSEIPFYNGGKLVDYNRITPRGREQRNPARNIR